VMSLFTSYCFSIAAYLITVERQHRLDSAATRSPSGGTPSGEPSVASGGWMWSSTPRSGSGGGRRPTTG
jgi:hypothetical protein